MPSGSAALPSPDNPSGFRAKCLQSIPSVCKNRCVDFRLRLPRTSAPLSCITAFRLHRSRHSGIRESAGKCLNQCVLRKTCAGLRGTHPRRSDHCRSAQNPTASLLQQRATGADPADAIASRFAHFPAVFYRPKTAPRFTASGYRHLGDSIPDTANRTADRQPEIRAEPHRNGCNATTGELCGSVPRSRDSTFAFGK